MRRALRRLSVLGGALAVMFVMPSCSGGDDDGGGGGGSSASADACPIGAIEEAGGGPVEITFWHSFQRANEESLIAMTEEFNASQPDVQVELVNQTTYEDLLGKFRAGLASGDLPDLTVGSETSLQLMIDSRAVLPVQACIDAEDYPVDDFLPRVLDYYTVEDVLYPMPFNVANPVFYFNTTLFEQAGLDPANPPATLDEVREAAEVLQAAGTPTPLSMEIYGWFYEQWLAKAGDLYVNNGNGREARATEAVFDTEVGVEVLTWLDEMVADGLAITNPEGSIDHFLAIGNGNAAMTISSASALGAVTEVLQSGEYAGTELGVGPMPGPSGEGGVIVGGGGIFIVNKSAPEKQEASWRFLQYLNEPEQVARFAADSGYIPTRQSAVDLPVLQTRWEEEPGFRVAYDQFLEGTDNDASSGAVLGELPALRKIIEDAEIEILTEGKDPAEALRDAQERADEVIRDYNERLGV